MPDNVKHIVVNLVIKIRINVLNEAVCCINPNIVCFFDLCVLCFVSFAITVR